MSRISVSLGLVLSLVLVGLTGTPAHAVLVTPVSVVASSEANSAAVHLIDSSGLSVNSSAGLHDNAAGAATMWTMGTSPGQPAVVDDSWVEFDLGNNYNLTNTYIWQYNQNNLPGRQTKQFDLLVSSTTSGAFTTTILTDSILNQNLTTPNGIPAQNFTTVSPNVRRVRIELDSAWSGNASEFAGLSEVRFEIIPEPTAAGIVFAGASLMVRRRRRVA
jgi:hypothetical protein